MTPMLASVFESKLTITIIGGLFGLSSTLVPLIEKLMRERTAQDQRDEHLNRITKQVAFWDAWFKAQQNVCSQEELQQPRARVLRELRQLSPDDWMRTNSSEGANCSPSHLLGACYWRTHLSTLQHGYRESSFTRSFPTCV